MPFMRLRSITRPSSHVASPAALWLVCVGFLTWPTLWFYVVVSIGVLGLVWPRAVRELFIGLTILTLPIGWAVSHLLLAVLSFCSIALVCLGIAIVRGVLRRNERMAAALRVSQELIYIEQERSHVTLGSIADAVTLKVTGSTSANTGVSPACRAISGITQNVSAGKMISPPGGNPNASRM